jgi:cell division transport system ATP-binding protein
VLFGGRNVGKISRRQIPWLRRQIGIVFQDHSLLTDRRVFDNVALPLVIAGVAYPEIRRRVRAALDKVGLLEKERMYPPMLSGGQQQRVGIARAIVGKPPLLLADEPTGNLDPELSAELMQFFVSLNELGTTVLIASHDLDLIRRLGRRVLVLKDGGLADDVPARLVGST